MSLTEIEKIKYTALGLAEKISCDETFVKEVSAMSTTKEKFLYLFEKFEELGYPIVNPFLFTDTAYCLQANHKIDMGLDQIEQTKPTFH